ncbi:hypothetical protein [Bernardetia sp.]|uniref:hypothetical protein n=1 Tax=Bernardetia sp. TaxID=1937974 RepID=UPI0025BAFCB1|nr:hypothetical protein [Bernardetia sp.]
MLQDSKNKILDHPLLIWIFSLVLHSILFLLVYSVFWASYSETTFIFLQNFSPQKTLSPFFLWLLIVCLGVSFSAIFVQLFASFPKVEQKTRVLILYILVFFVAFIPLSLWLDKHVVAAMCVLSGVSLLIINFKKNILFYTNSFVGILLCLAGLFWSSKGFGWAMAASIPFSLWYLQKENIKRQFPQFIVLVSLILLATLWDFIQDEIITEPSTTHFSSEKIKKNVPQWLLDEHLIEVGWSKNDFRLWLGGFKGFDTEKKDEHFSKESIAEITDFLLHYDTAFPVEGNPILELRYVFLQIALLVFWFLFLKNDALSRYRLLTYWAVLFLIWAWTEYISQDDENGFLIALCAFGGLLPLIGANRFKDIVFFKNHQKIIFIGIVILIVVELTGSLAVYISKSIETRREYEESKAVLEIIYQAQLIQKNIYIDWNAHLVYKTSLPFSASILSKFNKEQLENHLVLPIQEAKKINILSSEVYFVFLSPVRKQQTDMLRIYFSEHHNKLVEWKMLRKTGEIEVWKLIVF